LLVRCRGELSQLQPQSKWMSALGDGLTGMETCSPVIAVWLVPAASCKLHSMKANGIGPSLEQLSVRAHQQMISL
jgi:hypothetical protein